MVISQRISARFTISYLDIDGDLATAARSYNSYFLSTSERLRAVSALLFTVVARKSAISIKSRAAEPLRFSKVPAPAPAPAPAPTCYRFQIKRKVIACIS